MTVIEARKKIQSREPGIQSARSQIAQVPERVIHRLVRSSASNHEVEMARSRRISGCCDRADQA